MVACTSIEPSRRLSMRPFTSTSTRRPSLRTISISVGCPSSPARTRPSSSASSGLRVGGDQAQLEKRTPDEVTRGVPGQALGGVVHQLDHPSVTGGDDGVG